jgi:hypothetical protein
MLNWQGLNYNIADGQRLDRTRMAVVVALLIFLSGLFSYLTIDRFARRQEKFEKEISKLNAFQERINTLSNQSKEQKEQIERKKKQWGARVKFANLLIQEKNFSYITTLDRLESLLPAGVFIEEIAMKNGHDRPINFTLKADSYDTLLKTYGKISQRFDLTINKEFESAGLFTARLKVSHIK